MMPCAFARLFVAIKTHVAVLCDKQSRFGGLIKELIKSMYTAGARGYVSSGPMRQVVAAG